MSGEPNSQPQKTQPEGDSAALDPAVLDRIKHPPARDDVLQQLSPEELRGDQSVVPEMSDEAGDLRDDLKRDE